MHFYPLGNTDQYILVRPNRPIMLLDRKKDTAVPISCKITALLLQVFDIDN